jgi:hypothetical protein
VSLITLKSLSDALTSILSSPSPESVVAVGSGYLRADQLFKALALQQNRTQILVGLPISPRVIGAGMTSSVPLLAWTSRFASSRVVEAEAGVAAPTIETLVEELVGEITPIRSVR